jgi:hypothetical protein
MKEKIKELLVKNGKIIPQRSTKKFLEKHDIYNYIEKYFNNTYSLPEKIYCIVNDLEERKKCIECGNEITFRHGYANFCSRFCANNNIEVKEKNKISVSKSLLLAYQERGDEIKQKRNKTLEKKYGEKVNSPFELTKIKEQIEKTNLKKYGVKNVFYLNKFRANGRSEAQISSKEFNKAQGYDVSYSGPKKLLVKKLCSKHGDIEIDVTTFYNRAHRYRKGIICPICNPINSFSSLEINFEKILIDLQIGNYKKNIKTIIPPFELDFYFPEYNLAIELNGIYWHSELYKDKIYHKRKTDLCENKNIQLLQIWEDDFYKNYDLIKSMIAVKFKKIKNIIYARKTTVDTISSKIYRNFLAENHLQGILNSSIRYGLFYKKELVAVMGFGKLRKPLGKDDKFKHYELHRFCSKKYSVIIGGASKLLKEFERIYDYETLISYAKRDYSNGNLYKQLDFINKGNTSPGYYWLVEGERKHRYNYRKDKIMNEDNKHMTAIEIMHTNGYIRCFDSGNIRFLKRKNNTIKNN